MRLSDRDIIAALDSGKLAVEPRPSDEHICGVSIDLTLGNSFRVFNDHVAPYVDLSGNREDIEQTLNSIMSTEIVLEQDKAFFLHPGSWRWRSPESVTLPDDLVGWLDGRSSLAWLGLMVHVNGAPIDPGWSGQIVLEFFNGGKLPGLLPGMQIGAINFETLNRPGGAAL